MCQDCGEFVLVKGAPQMLDVDPFLTTVYVLVDEYAKAHWLAQTPTPGRPVSLCRSEALTLAIFGQWRPFFSERAFYRYATRHLRAAFPGLPDRTQYNRLLRQQYARLVALTIWVAEQLGAATAPYQVVDTTGVPTRQYKRRLVRRLLCRE